MPFFRGFAGNGTAPGRLGGCSRMNQCNLLRSGAAAVALAAALIGSAALADVKAGVDAWMRGDYTAAVLEWQGPAARGDADAQFNLAQAYRSGRGVKQDLAKAEELFGKAAAQGHVQAADNYGLMLFQRGEHARALPYLVSAADRGDPRAEYYLGLAYFNGDTVEKDWVRGYALVSLASQSGLEQARPALAQMDRYIPLPQRQQAVAVASRLAVQAQANRNRQIAAVELGSAMPTVSGPAPKAVSARAPASPSIAAAEDAIAEAIRVARGASPRTAGADYARPATPTNSKPAVAVAKPVRKATAPAASAPASQSAPAAATGVWRVQLGAFSVPGNADALWAKVKGRPELAGHGRLNVRAGSITKLQAGGFASHEAAAAACSRLTAAGIACIVARN